MAPSWRRETVRFADLLARAQVDPPDRVLVRQLVEHLADNAVDVVLLVPEVVEQAT